MEGLLAGARFLAIGRWGARAPTICISADILCRKSHSGKFDVAAIDDAMGTKPDSRGSDTDRHGQMRAIASWFLNSVSAIFDCVANLILQPFLPERTVVLARFPNMPLDPHSN